MCVSSEPAWKEASPRLSHFFQAWNVFQIDSLTRSTLKQALQDSTRYYLMFFVNVIFLITTISISNSRYSKGEQNHNFSLHTLFIHCWNPLLCSTVKMQPKPHLVRRWSSLSVYNSQRHIVIQHCHCRFMGMGRLSSQSGGSQKL